MTKTGWIIFAVICAALIGGLVYMSNQDKLDVSNINANAIQEPTAMDGEIGDHVYGNKESKVTLIEYGDYQCPGCGGIYPTVKEVKEELKSDIRFVFRNFPLSQIHPNARVAAAAAEAASLQGKYWEMHDLIYTGQSAWENLNGDERTDQFLTYAKQLGLDEGKFTSDLASSAVSSKIKFDTALGKKQNVTATPTFFLNGKTLDQDTWGDKEKLKKAIQDVIKEAK